MGQAQGSSECALAKTIKVIERHRITRLAQRRFQSRRAILWLVNKGALQIYVAESAMAACEIRIGCNRTLKISFSRIKPRRGESPQIP
jgi:hypothetical protein